MKITIYASITKTVRVPASVIKAADESAKNGEAFLYEGRGYVIDIPRSLAMDEGEPDTAGAAGLIMDGVDHIYPA
jgi:hypothetical protein